MDVKKRGFGTGVDPAVAGVKRPKLGVQPAPKLAGPAGTRLGGLQTTPATEGIKGCVELPGGVLMPWVGLGTCT